MGHTQGTRTFCRCRYSRAREAIYSCCRASCEEAARRGICQHARGGGAGRRQAIQRGVRKELDALLKKSDMNVITPKVVRRELEVKFGLDQNGLESRKEEVKQMISELLPKPK